MKQQFRSLLAAACAMGVAIAVAPGRTTAQQQTVQQQGGAAGGATVAALAVPSSPSATAAPDPCAASSVAKTVGSVANSTGSYLDSHPQTNQTLTATPRSTPCARAKPRLPDWLTIPTAALPGGSAGRGTAAKLMVAPEA